MNEMNIESATYLKDIYLDKNNAVIIVVDGTPMSVPLDPANRHYAEILKQVEAGTLVIQEAE